MADLNVKYFRNSIEGESLLVPAGIPLDAIPQKYRELIDDRHFDFLDAPARVLTSLSTNTSFEALSNWLVELSKASRFGIIVHHVELFGNTQCELTVCCVRPSRQHHFRLPNVKYPVDELPYPLNQLYRVTDGIIDSADAFMTSQFVAFPSLFIDFETSYPMENTPVANLADLLAFYRTETGDYLVADGDDAFAFSHEDCTFHRCGTVRHVLESYLRADLGSGRWTPFHAC